eukprot:PhF_6_TR21208/c0_g1_i1/m.30617
MHDTSPHPFERRNISTLIQVSDILDEGNNTIMGGRIPERTLLECTTIPSCHSLVCLGEDDDEDDENVVRKTSSSSGSNNNNNTNNTLLTPSGVALCPPPPEQHLQQQPPTIVSEISLQLSNAILLRDATIHAFLAALVVSPVLVVLNKYCLYEFFASGQYSNTTTFDDLSVNEQIRYKIGYYNVCEFCTIIQMLSMFTSMFQNLSRKYKVGMFVLMGFFCILNISVTYLLQYYAAWTMWFMGTALVVTFFMLGFTMLAIGVRKLGGSAIRYVLTVGVATCFAFLYALTIIAFEAFRKSEMFRWTSPF